MHLSRKYGTWLMLGSILFLFTACKSRPTMGPAPTMDLLSVFRQMPASLRENPFGEKSGLELTPAQMDQLISTREVVVSDDCMWELAFQDSAQNHLQADRLRSEEGLQYGLLKLKGKKNSEWVLITQRMDDHCCSYARWALFGAQNGELIDRTEGSVPKLNWLDFYSEDVFGKAGQPEGFRDNEYPISIEIKSNPPSIQIGLVADYIDLSFSNDISTPMLEHLPKEPKILVWEDEKFVWHKR